MSDEDRVRYDFNRLECGPWGGESSDAVITSLMLNDIGEMGSRITWSSDDKNRISDMGRVTRPRAGETPAHVRMTAVISSGGVSARKYFNFTVLPDPEFLDPGYESDQSFFSKLDVSKDGMEEIGRLAGLGEYDKAKRELLSLLRRKKVRQTEVKRFPSGMCRMMAEGVSTLQRCDRYYKGMAQIDSCEYEKCLIPLETEGIKNGAAITYNLCALYNETVGVRVAGSGCKNREMRPKLELLTEQGRVVLECEDSAVIGAGKNMDCVLKEQEELYIRLFGKFWGDGTFHGLLKFQISRLETEALEAKLILYAKKDKRLSGEKELLVLLFPENTWTGTNAKWSRFKWQTANRNGLPFPDTWEMEPGFDFEYLFQRVRFMHFPWLIQEYRESGDETYVYSVLKTMTEFIRARGMPYRYEPGNGHIGSAWRDESTGQTLCGGWPRGLDAAQRISSFAGVFAELVRSRFMTPEISTAILKYAWDACDSLAFKSLTKPVTNLRQFELIELLKAVMVFDDFKQQAAWVEKIRESLEKMIFSVTLPDGTYNETTGGYNVSVCRNFVMYRQQCIENGLKLSQEFEERLKKFALYNSLLEGPGGESLQYGDQGAGVSREIQYPELLDREADDELVFILTRGEYGREPSWTSYRFPLSGVTALRSGWEKDSVYLFTQARGGGHHGHQDDHHITLIAGGRVLLTDAGIFTYSQEDPYRQWGVSSMAHNTVCINDMAQEYHKGAGDCPECILDKSCDIVSQCSARYKGFSFIRRIVFLKPAVFIVTDEIIPEDCEQENEIKQAWHMMPDADISYDYAGLGLTSCYREGKNILIRSLDRDVQLKREMGWYDFGYQQLAENPFGYFVRSGVKGRTVLHTMIRIM